MSVFDRVPILFLTPTLLAASLGLITTPARAADMLAGLEERHWTVDGVDRAAQVYLPRGADTSPTPLVFVFHGHGGTAEDAMKDFAIHKSWREAIVVYPQGLPSAAPNDPNGEQTGWQYDAGENDDRDVGLFDSVLDDLRQNYKVDAKRIYAVGFSNGGGFAFVLWSMRGDQIAAVVSCAMKPRPKLLATFKPKPFFQIAGTGDKVQRLPEQEKTVTAIAEINECGKGRPWRKNADCAIYPSKLSAPMVVMIHPGGHEVPKAAPARIVEFLRNELQSVRRGNPAVGDWHLNQPSVGPSNLHITEAGGKLQVQEIGNGKAKSTMATCEDGLLVIHWQVDQDLRGYWVLDLNEEHTKGTGKTVFVRFKDFKPGEAREIEGRQVRVVEGVTIERFDPTVR